jgi:hypothetical protein
VVLNILSICHRICEGTSLIRRLDELTTIDFGDVSQFDRANKLIWSLDPPILDAVRIATCFENLLKTRLLLRGYVIHQIDKRASNQTYRPLADEQRKRPIKISEVKHAEGLKRKRGNQYVFHSLSAFRTYT